MREITVTASHREHGLLLADSAELPGLHLAAVSEDELRRDAPACIEALLAARNEPMDYTLRVDYSASVSRSPGDGIGL